MEIRLRAEDEAATADLARGLAGMARPGDVITLAGPLGAGKSTFARAFLRALGETGEVPSPTFTLVQSYEPPDAPCPVHHFDCYRLEGPEDAIELDMDDAFAADINLIEWAERIAPILPADRLDITIAIADSQPDMREITLLGHRTWAERLMDIAP